MALMACKDVLGHSERSLSQGGGIGLMQWFLSLPVEAKSVIFVFVAVGIIGIISTVTRPLSRLTDRVARDRRRLYPKTKKTRMAEIKRLKRENERRKRGL
jgi:hypothetical protein